MTSSACTRCASPLSAGARFCSHCGLEVHTIPAVLPRDASGALHRGTVIEQRYKIMNVLGQGGFSRVYGAIDLRLRTPCALKENSVLDPGAYEQFVTEAQLLARLRHLHLTKVTDYFVADDGSQFLVMEYVPGHDIENELRTHPLGLDWRIVAGWGEIICDVLTYLHTHEPPIIHRDIKPGNLRVTPDGTLMVIDLGIAKVQHPGTATQLAAQAYSGGYSSPEQMLGQGTDARSDIYSLGATLYHLLSGEMPLEAVHRLRGARLEPLERLRSDVPTLMARAIDRAVSLEPAERPPSAQALALVFNRIAGAQAEAAVVAPVAVEAQPQAALIPTTPVTGQTSRAAAIDATVPALQLRVEPRPENIIWPQDGREMVRIPAGPVVIGSEGFDADEQPQHTVMLPAFLIDRFPVTCAEYARFVGASGHAPPSYWGGAEPPAAIEDHPVVEVSYEDARSYATWAGKRLPTEAEWEKAACWDADKAAAYVYPWGDPWEPTQANTRDGGAGGTVPIGSYTPQGDSPFGVAEMVGNTWEWTSSVYRRYPYDAHDGREKGETSGLRVTRGGSWSCSSDVVRVANRNVAASGDADHELGFRCAADLSELFTAE